MAVVKFDSKVSWTVAVACALLNSLVLIPTKVSGLFFVEILDRYKVGRSIAGYPSFTVTLMRCSGGPLAGYLAERFGINEVMVLGGLLSGVGISACFFAEDIVAVTVFLGLIHGMGLSCTNTFSPQIVKVHFRKHLTLAFGVTQTGASLGAFLTPPLLLKIFQTYGTSGGFLIVGAIVLNALPIILYLNILSPNKLYYKSDDSIKSVKCPEGHLEMGVATPVTSDEVEYDDKTNNTDRKKGTHAKMKVGCPGSEIQNNLENKALAAPVLCRSTYDNIEFLPDSIESRALRSSCELTTCNLSMERSGSEYVPFSECGPISNVRTKYTIDERTKVASIENINALHYDLKEESPPLNNGDGNQLHSKTECKLKTEIDNNETLKYGVGERKECYSSKHHSNDTHPFTSMNNVLTSNCIEDQERTQEQIIIEKGEGNPSKFDALKLRTTESNEPSYQETNPQKELKSDKKLSTGTTNAKKSLKIFLDLTFWIVMITQSIQVFALIIFWTTMIDFSRDKNIDRNEEVYLLMTLPISEIMGRLCLGWITDGKYLTRINFSIISFIMMGCSFSLMAWAQGFYAVAASIFIFGIISSGLITVFPIIIFEFFDSDKHTMGQASKYSLFGPLSFLNGPLIGYFRGTLGSYDWLYHTLAVVLIACGALSTIIPVLARMRDEKKTRS